AIRLFRPYVYQEALKYAQQQKYFRILDLMSALLSVQL
ncbi:aminotransferase class-V family protein, partial [Chlamydia psittaci 06-1683]